MQYLQNGNAYKVQSWYTDRAQRPATGAVTYKVKSQGRKVM